MKNKINYLLTLFLVCLGLGVSSPAWGYSVSNGTVYFNNTNSQWEHVQLLIGRKADNNNHSKGIGLTHIENTQLWGSSSISYDNYGYYVFVNASGSWGDANQEPWARIGGASNHSKTCDKDFNGHVWIHTPKSAGNEKDWNVDELSGGYSDLNKKQTVVLMISTDGGSTYTDYSSDWKGNKVIANRYTLDNATTAGSHDKTLDGTDADKKYASAVLTSSVTFTASADDNFTFAGWATDNKGPDDTNASYTYTVSDTKTIYAYFNEKVSTITLVGCTEASTTAGPITTGTATAKEPAGKEVTGFQSDGGVTNMSAMANKAVTFNATAAGTVTAQFAYKTPTIVVDATVTYTLGGAAIKLNPKYSDLAEGATYNWTCTAASGEGATADKVGFTPNATAANPNISASVAGTYTITLTATNGTGAGSMTSEVKTITLTVTTADDKCATCFTQTGSTK